MSNATTRSHAARQLVQGIRQLAPPLVWPEPRFRCCDCARRRYAWRRASFGRMRIVPPGEAARW